MGQLLGNLTNPNTALVSPQGQTTFTGSPAQVMSKANAGLPTAADLNAAAGPDVLHPQDTSAAFKNLPFIGKASFSQAANSGPYGMPNAASPELSKGGKLVTLLTSGLKGALAGRAAQEQMIAQTGGRRAGGIGTEFQAGFQLPFQQAQLGQQMQQQQAQTELTKQQGSMVQTPYGPLPAALAKAILPKEVQGQYGLEGKKIEAGSRENVANTQSQTQEKVHRFVPTPVGLFDTQTRQVIPETEQGITVTPEIAQDHSLPKEFIGKPMTLSNLAAVQRSDVFQNSPMMTAQGPIVVNRKSSTATPVKGPGGQSYSPPALASPREIADMENPGQTKIVSGGTAIAQGAPGASSASVQAPKKTLEAFTSGGYSQKLNSIATAREHMKTFRSLAEQLDNGNMQSLNALGNAIGVEFGKDNVTNFNIAKQFFSGEVGQAVVNGGGTADERDKLAAAISNKSSWKQLSGALSTADALLKGKQTALTDTFETGMQGKPNFGTKPPATQQPKGSKRVLVEGKDF